MNGLNKGERKTLDAIRALSKSNLAMAKKIASRWMLANKRRRVLREAASRTIRFLRS